jgi:carnitine 3-dehydrogenase
MSLVSEGVVSVADADATCAWGPGLRWGVMGPVMLNHLGGGLGGIEQFYKQFSGPLVTWWTSLADFEFTQEVQEKMIAGLRDEVGNRDFHDLALERDRLLLALLNARLAGNP